MDIKAIVDLVVNNGVAIAIVIYFCLRDWKFQETLVRTLTTITEQNETIKKIITRLNDEEDDGK